MREFLNAETLADVRRMCSMVDVSLCGGDRDKFLLVGFLLVTQALHDLDDTLQLVLNRGT